MRNGEFFTRRADQQSGEYIIKNLISRNRLIIGASIPGEGKSLLGMCWLYHVAYGAKCLGEDVIPGSVMFIDSDNRHDVLRARASKIKRGLELDGYEKQGEIDFQHYSGLLLDESSTNKNTWGPIIKAIEDIRPSLIMLDHLRCFHRQDEDKSKPMNRVADALDELMAEGESSLLVMHHFNKNVGTFYKRLRGSSVLYARSDAAYEFRALSRKEGRLEKVGLIPQSRKDITGSPIRITIDEGPDWIRCVHDGIYQPMDDPKMDRIYHDIFHLFLHSSGNKTVDDVKRALAGYASDSEIRESLRGLEDKELLYKDIGASGAYLYALVQGKNCPWCSQ